MMAQSDLVVVGIDVAKDKVDACIRSGERGTSGHNHVFLKNGRQIFQREGLNVLIELKRFVKSVFWRRRISSVWRLKSRGLDANRSG